jgi:deazaflavin-dependent oxidoreductase (nitroreductase family)
VTRRLGRPAYTALALTARQRWFVSLHRAAYRRLHGRGPLGHVLGCDMLLLTTTGRHSGLRRTVPLFAFSRTAGPGAGSAGWVVVASNTGLPHEPAWWLNLQADPRATVELGEATWSVTARLATGDERARLWATVSAAYPGYLQYEQDSGRSVPLVVLEPG